MQTIEQCTLFHLFGMCILFEQLCFVSKPLIGNRPEHSQDTKTPFQEKKTNLPYTQIIFAHVWGYSGLIMCIKWFQ